MSITVAVLAALYDTSLGGGSPRMSMYCEMIMYAFVCFAVRLGSTTSRKFEFLLEEIEGAVIHAGHEQHRKMNRSLCI